MGSRLCPKCSGEMDYVAAEPDVGIMTSVYSCTQCDYIEEVEEEDEHDLD